MNTARVRSVPALQAYVVLTIAAAVAIAALLAAGSYRDDTDVATRLLWALPGCAGFMAGGLIALREQPYNRAGRFMLAIGVTWALRWIDPSTIDWVSNLAFPFAWLWSALFLHLAFAFPRGRLETRFTRGVIVMTYIVAVGLQLARMATLSTQGLRDLGCDLCVNHVQLVDARGLGGTLDTVQTISGAVIALIGCVYFSVRWRRSDGPERRALSPVLQLTAATGLATAIYLGSGAIGWDGLAQAFKWTQVVLFALVPLAFAYALVRMRVVRGAALSTLLTRLNDPENPEPLDRALAKALDDPSMQIVYWVEGRGYCVSASGQPAELPADGSDRAVTYIALRGRRVAAVIHDPWLREQAGVVQAAGSAAALWFEREQLEAELRLRVLELKESRTRIVEAGDLERRRIERDLHDGAQQRLAALLIHAKLTRRLLGGAGGELGALLDQLELGLAESLSELRALAAGILPPVLSDFGLAAAVEELAARTPIPVDVAVTDERLAPGIEVAAYFVVAESLANALKHSRATRVAVRVTHAGEHVRIEVRDDGVGGIDLDAGTGVKGLADRVGALGGTLECVNGPSGGVILRAELPLRQETLAR